MFTRTVTEEDFAEIDGLRHCPMVFQEKIPKHVELRVTVVGDELFVASIDCRKAGVPVDDWRRAASGVAARFERDQVPPPVRDAVLQLMKTFGLVYGAIDIIRTPDGRHVFLEINPAGEWGWIHTEVGLPIADALADVLTGAVAVDRQHCSLL